MRIVPFAAALVGLTVLGTPALAQQKACANPNGLGVSRTVEIDTKGGPGFGLEHYKVHDFLQPKEVVLTFDDGPQKIHTENVLKALGEHCTKATFFSIGKMALGYPDIIRHVASEGHTVGTHTWSHQNLKKMTEAGAVDEIERGISAVKRAVGGPISPFFRFPQLADSGETLKHLQGRNIAMFSTDIDSFDFKIRTAEGTVKSVIDRLEKKGKGIVLMHDIQPHTGKAVPALLAALKAKGYQIVHLKAKGELASLPEFDTAIEASVKGLPSAGGERPTSSVVRTIDENAPKTRLGGEPDVKRDATVVPAIIAPKGVSSAGPNTENIGDGSGRKWFWQGK
ncbi:MAG: polysaccharide deacetylase family protein [Hyphomicrobiaceae bacterium]